MVSVIGEDGAARKCSASLPLRGPSPKRPCATGDGGQSFSSSVLTGPPLVRPEASDCEKGTDEASLVCARLEVGSEGCHYALGAPDGKDQGSP